MTQQVELGNEGRAHEIERGDGTREVVPDIAYLRTMIVNVVLFGLPGAEDRKWVLIDTGLPGGKSAIKSAAERRFGPESRPAAIILTHGHFDHVANLSDLAEEWDAPIYAHELERPYLDARASYPPGDPSVGGGLLAATSWLLPTKPLNVSRRLRSLPEDGSVPSMPGWRWIHTPGHSPGHVSLWREPDRALIVGDAFITTAQESVYAALTQSPEMHGPPKYFTIDWEASKRSVERLCELEPEYAITGHGLAMHGGSLRAALKTLARDFDQVAVPEDGIYLREPAKAEDGSAYRRA